MNVVHGTYATTITSLDDAVGGRELVAAKELPAITRGPKLGS